MEEKEPGSVAWSTLPAHKQKTGSLANQKGTAVVTDVGGTDYSRAVCVQIFQAVSFDGFPQVLGVTTNRPLVISFASSLDCTSTR